MPTPDTTAAFALAQELASAGGYTSRQTLFRAVNEALDLDWTDAAWRGHMNRNPDMREGLDKALGTVNVIHRADALTEVVLTGDFRGSVSSDEHVPFHDPKAIALTCEVLSWWKPTVHIFDGDQNDWYGLSKFDTNPMRQ